MSENIGSPRVAAAQHEVDREFAGIHDAEIEWALRHPEGRGLLRRIVFGLCRLAEPSLAPNAGVKDGLAMMVLTARNEGLREAGSALGAQCERVGLDLWDLALTEGRVERMKRNERRAAASRQAATDD